MSAASLRGLFVVSSFALAILLAGASHATNVVEPGFDLFTTRTGTNFDFGGFAGLGFLELEGRPLGSFDFGSGPVLLPKTDTIVRRLQQATVASPTIDIEIIALQLRSVDPVDIGNGPEHILIDLDSPISGQMTINGLGTEGDPHGTFDSSLDFVFVVSGTISGFLGPIPTSLSSSGTPWRHPPAPGEPVIAGVNFRLNGVNQLTDFWLLPGFFVNEVHPGVGVHVAGPKVAAGSTGQCFFGPGIPVGGAGFFPDVKTPPMLTSDSIAVPWCVHHGGFTPNVAGYRFALSYDQSEVDVIHTGPGAFLGPISPFGVPQPSISLPYPALPPSVTPTPLAATRTHTVWFPPPTALASGTSLMTSTTLTLATFQLHARHTSLTNSDFDFAVLASPILHAVTTITGTSVSRWVPGIQTWIMTTFISPSSFYIPKTTSWVFSSAAFLGIEHPSPDVPALTAGSLAVLAGTLMLGSSWALRRRRNAANR
jgi:hypothetical protein